MIKEIKQANRIIESCFSKMRTARMYLQFMDEITPFKKQRTNKLLRETIISLQIDTLCCVCKYNITTIHKHLLLSEKTDSIFFIKELCATIYEILLALDEYESFLKKHFAKNIFEEYMSKRNTLKIYDDTLRKIRNKSVYHICKNFRIYYDKMLEIFNIPIIDIWNLTIELIEYLQIYNKEVMINKMKIYKSLKYDDANSFIQKLENEIIRFPNDENKKSFLNELKRIINE